MSSTNIPEDDPLLAPIPPAQIPFHPIPPPASPDAIVSVRILATSSLTAPKKLLARTRPDEDPEVALEIPCFSFLIEKDGEAMFWDLGLMEDLENAVPQLCEKTFKKFVPHAGPSAMKQLTVHGYDTRKITTLFLSHDHFDHYGSLDELGADVTIVMGPGSLESIGRGHPADPNAAWPQRWLEERHFVELPRVDVEGEWTGEVGTMMRGKGRRWEAVACFDKGVNWFGDGSLWFIDGPGHCPGHMLALARVTASPATYVLLAADASHHQELYLPVPTPEHPADARARIPYAAGEPAIDRDPLAANQTISRLTRMSAEQNVMVLLAHEVEAGGVLPLFPDDGSGLRDWQAQGWKAKKEEDVRRHAGW